MSYDILVSKPYLEKRLNHIFFYIVDGIKSANLGLLIKVAYDNNLTTEERIIAHSNECPTFWIENNVNKYDSDAIIKYAKSKGLGTSLPVTQTVGSLSYFSIANVIID